MSNLNYQISGKTYEADDIADLFNQIKNRNSHTKDLTLIEYLTETIDRINERLETPIGTPKSDYDIPEIGQQVLDAWKEIGIARQVHPARRMCR